MVEPDWTHAHWRKSRRSGQGNGCVECATNGDLVGVRDSKDPEGVILVFDVTRWREFVDGIKAGEFDPR